MSPPPDAERCPICDKPVAQKRFAPFCSRRCADLDLGRWLKGSYAIAGTDSDEPDGTPGDSEPPEDA